MLGVFTISGAALGGSAAPAAPPPPFDPSSVFSERQGHSHDAISPRHRFRTFALGSSCDGWLHHAAEDVKASRMTWFALPVIPLYRPPNRLLAHCRSESVGPLDYSNPVYTTAQLMGWNPDGIHGPLRTRALPKWLASGYVSGIESTTIVDAYFARIYAIPTYGADLDSHTSYAGIVNKEP